MRRHGFSALLLVMGAAFLLMIWALAQQFTQSSIRRRVRISEGGRRALLQATTAIEEGIDAVLSTVNDGDPDDTELSADLGAQLRELAPGEVIEFSFAPALAEAQVEGLPIVVSRVQGTAFLLAVEDEVGKPPRKFTCKKYKTFLDKWSQVPG